MCDLVRCRPSGLPPPHPLLVIPVYATDHESAVKTPLALSRSQPARRDELSSSEVPQCYVRTDWRAAVNGNGEELCRGDISEEQVVRNNKKVRGALTNELILE